MKKFRTSYYGNEIEDHDILRETEKSVWFMEKQFSIVGKDKFVERKESKVAERYRWHETWEAAHAFLLDEAEKNLASARRRLERAQGEYGNVKGMKKP